MSERIRQTYSMNIEKKEKYGENMKEPKKKKRKGKSVKETENIKWRKRITKNKKTTEGNETLKKFKNIKMEENTGVSQKFCKTSAMLGRIWQQLILLHKSDEPC